MAPILRVMSDGATRDRSEIIQASADEAGVESSERLITLTTGQPMYANRVGWAISHLSRAGALSRPERGRYVISDLGRTVLTTRPDVSRSDVEAATGYQRTRPMSEVAGEQTDDVESLNPAELIDQGIKQIQADVAAELLARLMTKPPTFFEQTVVDLLVAMGYGGAEGQARVTSASNDGGIDGIIDQDTLGLSRVYVQAKRYSPDNAVGRPEVQGFVGALSGKADGGVFITTGRFSGAAAGYAAAVPTRVILIDGSRLTSLMIRFGIGVQTKQTVRIVELDEDYFE